MNDDIAVARAREAGEPRPCGSGRSTSFIPAVPAASSVTTIAFIRHLPVSSSRLLGEQTAFPRGRAAGRSRLARGRFGRSLMHLLMLLSGIRLHREGRRRTNRLAPLDRVGGFVSCARRRRWGRPWVETVSAIRQRSPSPRRGATTKAKAPRPGVAIVPSTTMATKRYTMVRTMSAFRIDVVLVLPRDRGRSAQCSRRTEPPSNITSRFNRTGSVRADARPVSRRKCDADPQRTSAGRNVPNEVPERRLRDPRLRQRSGMTPERVLGVSRFARPSR
jgi:hypothetical protein